MSVYLLAQQWACWIPRQDFQAEDKQSFGPLGTLTSKCSNDFMNSTWKTVPRRRMMMMMHRLEFWESPPTHFHPAVLSSFMLHLHLQSAQQLQRWGAPLLTWVKQGQGKSHILGPNWEQSQEHRSQQSLTFCTCPPVQLSNYKQALSGHPYKICRIFLHLPFSLRLSIKKALWKLLLSI